ncbi:DUF1223 domain-containing protein [uncultured Hymenobacter sp.]|uniref:DUF1223 domain-containing protein n=1 Tax=uncultured Hymenobacter sp. TaxID=170016 RepID=UPI0035CB7DDB
MHRIALAVTPLLLTAASAVVLVSSRPAPAPGRAARPAAAAAPTATVPVVVELFTSEGCSSCPSADAALRELTAAQSVPGVEVIALGQHVDYWNRLGWKDQFSAAQFTQRQQWYAQGFGEGNYTPQAVVNGRYEFVGSQKSTLAQTVAKAAQAPRATVTLTRSAAGALHVQVSHLPAGTQAASVELALTETGLSSQVGRGENSGRLLRHAAVVRSWRPLGAVKADGTFVGTTPLDLSSNWKTDNLRAVVLVQETGSRHVVGVGSLPLGSKSTALN